MKKISTYLLSYLVISCLISCQQINSCKLTEQEKVIIENEIDTIVRNFLNARTLSYQSEMALRANVDGYVMGGDGQIKFTNYNDLDEYVKKAFAGIQKFTECEVPSLYVYVLAKDAATCTFQLNAKFLSTSGDTVVHNACWTMVFKKFDNEWKVIQENGTHT